MGKVNDALGPLIEKFATLAGQVQSLRFALGDTVNDMLSIPGVTMAMIERRLKARIPNAKDMLGYALTAKNLDAMATMARTWREDGGILHGKHRVSREDIEALDLTPAEGKRLAELATAGHVRVKSIAKAARAVRNAKGKDSTRATAARDRLRQVIAKGSEKQVSVQSIAQIRERLDAIEKARAKLDKEERELRATLAELEAKGEERTAVEAPKPAAAPTAEPPAKEKPRRRKPSKGKRPASQPSA